jgi:hypothetical protein
MRGPWLYPANEAAYDNFMFRRKLQALLILLQRRCSGCRMAAKSLQPETKGFRHVTQ